MGANGAVAKLRFRRAPLAAAAVWFAVGIGADHLLRARVALQPAVLLLTALALLGGLSLAAFQWGKRVAWVPVAGLWVVLGMAAGEWQPGPVLPVKLLGFSDDLTRIVRGRVVLVKVPPPEVAAGDEDMVPPWEATEERHADELRVTVDLTVDEIEDLKPDTAFFVPVRGGVRVTVYGAAPAMACGDRVEMPVALTAPDRYRDPGAFDYAGYLLGQGVAARGTVSGSKVHPLIAEGAMVRPRELSISCKLAAAQGWASNRLLGLTASRAERAMPRLLRLTQADALMLNAMLFGDRTGLTHRLRTGFERTGSFHLFVVSGLHIALMATAIYWVLRRLRAAEWLATLLTLAGTAAYAAVTGFGQPAQRALAMTAVFLLARLLSRERDSLNALGAAVLAMLVWAPASLFDASLQMTALVIVAIAGIAVPLWERWLGGYAQIARGVFAYPRRHVDARESQLRLMLEMWGEELAGVAGQWAKWVPARIFRLALGALQLTVIAVVAELVMVLPMTMYFHRAAVFALPANMVVIPVIAVLAPAAVATFLCSLISPWLALVPGALTAGLLHAIAYVIARLSHLQAADVRVPGPAWWVALLAVALWAACCWLARRSVLGAWVTVAALPLIATMVLWPEPPMRQAGVLEVTALDVGQGDSLLAVAPDGRSMLIDAGGPVGRGRAEVVSNFDVGEEVVSPYLWSRRMRRLDVVVLTHAHTDHMGGMAAVLENFRPRELWVGIDPRSQLYAGLLAQAARLGIVVRHFHAGDEVAWGEVKVSVLAPAVEYGNAGAPRNDDSLVMNLQYGKANVLLEGDAEKQSEDVMVAAGRVHPVTLLKVGHHGSRTSTNPEFVAVASPAAAVVSVGRRNTFGHPRGEVIARLADQGTRVARTDEMGLVTFLLTKDGAVRTVFGGSY